MIDEIRILQGDSRYDVFRQWQQALQHGLQQMGVHARIVSVAEEATLPATDNTVSLGFNLVRQWTVAGRERRHVAWTVDHPAHVADFFFPQVSRMPVNPDRCLVASVDQYWAQFAREVYGFPRAGFLPHATACAAATAPDWSARAYDVVFIGSLAAPDRLAAELRKTAGPFQAVVDDLLGYRYDSGRRLDAALLDAGRRRGLAGGQLLFFFNAFFPLLDQYHRNRHRLEALQSLGRQAVHVFGDGDWSRVSLPAHVVRHPAVPFADVPGLLAQARVLLNSSPAHAGGAHERVFDALACGCAVLTTPSVFLAAEFGAGQGLAFYGAPGMPPPQDQAAAWLGDPARATAAVAAAQAQVMARHTMTARAADLLALIRSAFGGQPPRAT